MGLVRPDFGEDEAKVLVMPPADFRERAFKAIMGQGWMVGLEGIVGIETFVYNFVGAHEAGGKCCWDIKVTLRHEYRGRMAGPFESRLLEGMVVRIW